jgi:hypothetical protein
MCLLEVPMYTLPRTPSASTAGVAHHLLRRNEPSAGMGLPTQSANVVQAGLAYCIRDVGRPIQLARALLEPLETVRRRDGYL